MSWPPPAFIYMKVGPRGGETLDQISVPQGRELQHRGRILWGYGGKLLHPRTQGLALAQEWAEKQGSAYSSMERLQKPARSRVASANTTTHYCTHGNEWGRLPNSVQTGPDYALLIGDITPVERELDLPDFCVGIADSAGKNAADYIRHRVDKGCFVAPEEGPNQPSKPVVTA